MKKIIFTFFLSCLGVAALGQVTRTFSLRGFDRLHIGSAFVIDVSQGAFSITASGREQDLNGMEVGVSQGTLTVRYEAQGRWSQNREAVRLSIRLPQLQSIDFSGASRSTISGFRQQEDFSVSLSGASKAKIDTDTKRLLLDLSGASSLELSGQAHDLKSNCSGAATLMASALKVATARLDVSGASRARLGVSDDLSISASGASNVRYRGRPRMKLTASGASSVRTEEN